MPEVNEDGNERAGIRLPQIAVPLATYTGWNFRQPANGSPGELVSLLGSTIPFPVTRAEREKTKDSRRSIEEQYRSQDQCLEQVQKVLDDLVIKGYLVYDDGPRILQRATDEWDLLVTERSPGPSADLHFVADEEAAGFERRVPRQAEVLPVDRDLGLEPDPLSRCPRDLFAAPRKVTGSVTSFATPRMVSVPATS